MRCVDDVGVLGALGSWGVGALGPSLRCLGDIEHCIGALGDLGRRVPCGRSALGTCTLTLAATTNRLLLWLLLTDYSREQIHISRFA